MKRLVLCVAMLVLSGVGRATGAPVVWPVEDGGNGHYYELVAVQLSWSGAKLAAEQSLLGDVTGHLVTITSEQENQFVLNNVGLDAHEPWIGLTDSEQYGGQESLGKPNPQVDGWVWVTREPVSFTSWGPGEPNEYRGMPEDFAHVSNQGGSLAGWNDVVIDWYRSDSYIVEYDTAANAIPEPSAMIVWSLLGASGVGIGWCGRKRQAA